MEKIVCQAAEILYSLSPHRGVDRSYQQIGVGIGGVLIIRVGTKHAKLIDAVQKAGAGYCAKEKGREYYGNILFHIRIILRIRTRS